MNEWENLSHFSLSKLSVVNSLNKYRDIFNIVYINLETCRYTEENITQYLNTLKIVNKNCNF